MADEQVKYTPEDLERSAAIEEAIFDKAQTIEINGEVYRLHESSLISESYAALIAQIRREEHQKAERLAELLEKVNGKIQTAGAERILANNFGELAIYFSGHEVRIMCAALADFRKGQANEQV